MTKVDSFKITCPRCSQTFERDIYQSVNVTLDPDLKNKVLNRSINIIICPECGANLNWGNEFVYHDMQKNLLITEIPFENIANWPRYEMEGIEFRKKYEEYFDPQSQNEPSKRVRIVFGWNHLLEKILIFERDLNDVVIMLQKALLINSNQAGEPGKLFFLSTDIENGTITYSMVKPDGSQDSITLPFSQYLSIKEENEKNKYYSDDWQFVDYMRIVGPFSINNEEIKKQFTKLKSTK